MVPPRICFFDVNSPITVTGNHFEFAYGGVAYRFLHCQQNRRRGQGETTIANCSFQELSERKMLETIGKDWVSSMST
ncbi:unnamed protein product, partial [Mesorhabditis belari]|uniref:Uncharacterized protein n=1 Tax=Mesorhabditis belari TaxID=2138241 RepID=A0AAF3E899_9BILA